MNVDEAMETAKAYLVAREQMQEPLFESEEVAVALAKEVERLRAEVEMSHSFHRVAVKERDFERLLVEALKEELAAAKAASVCPVGITDLSMCDSGHRIEFYIEGDKSDGEKMLVWLRQKIGNGITGGQGE